MAHLGGQHGGHRKAPQALPGVPGQAAVNANIGAAIALAIASIGTGVSRYTCESIEDAGFRAGEVRAWRVWGIDGFALRSVFTGTVWVPGEPMAGDPKEWGVHAWKQMDGRLRQYVEVARSVVGSDGFIVSGSVVVGQVDLWGDIVEHEHGYRAEFAAIVSLDYGIGIGAEKLGRLRRHYGVAGQ